MFKFGILIFSLLIFAQCRRIVPVAPEIVVEEIPDLSQKESSIYIPIKINLKPYLKDAEASLDKTFTGKEENCSGVSYSYKFERDPIKFEGMGKYLYYEIDGKYSLKLNYCPECTHLFSDKGSCVIPRVYMSCGVGEPMRKVKVAYTTHFKISPDLKFKSITELRKFETPDACEVSMFNYDATDKLRGELLTVLKDLEKDIDKEISSIDIRTEIESIWQKLCEQNSLGKYGYLCISPKAISLGNVQFDKDNAYVDLNLTVKPVVTTYPREFSVTNLPMLNEHKKEKGFDINLDIIATYDSLSSILTSNLTGKKVMIKKNEVIFGNISIEGASNEQIIMKVAFDGKRSGVLYLTGTPKFDPSQQIISFPDLSYDLETKNKLLKSAKWLFNSKITDILRKNAVFDLKPHLNEMKKTIQKEMNREIQKGVELNGQVESISLMGIYPNNENLIIRVNSKGEVRLSM